MAILIVDDEGKTREVLRTLLSHMGHSPVLEARDGEEALRVLSATGSRVRMIVADWEMPYMDGMTLLKEVASLPELDLAPFLLITSDLPGGEIEKFQSENPRLDGHLLKPFRQKALEQAMVKASQHRAAARDTIIIFGKDPALADRFSTEIKKGSATLWRSVVAVESQEELVRAMLTHERKVGALLVEQASVSRLDAEWLSAFKKTPRGAVTPVVCLGRDPGAIRAVRTQCQVFVQPSDEASFLPLLLAKLSKRILSLWETEAAALAVKTCLQKKDFKTARTHALALLELDELSAEGHALAGEVCERLGDPVAACRHYRHATQVNPCAPRPWIKLLELLPGSASEVSHDRLERLSAAESASQFCPASSDVLLAAARAWQTAGRCDRAKEAVQQVLESSPSHEGARELLKALSGEGVKK